MGSRCLNDKDLNYLEFAESFLLIFPCDYSFSSLSNYLFVPTEVSRGTC